MTIAVLCNAQNRLVASLEKLSSTEVANVLAEALSVGWTVQVLFKASSTRENPNSLRTLKQRGASTRLGRVRIPPGAPPWITEEDIAETIAVWQPYSKTPLDEDDALEILVNVRQLLELMFRGDT